MAQKLDRLSMTLGKILKNRGFQGRLHEYRIFGQWERCVGAMIAHHAQPQSVRGGRLLLIVDSPAWMQQLTLLKPEIIEKLNTSLGRAAIKDITLKLGEVMEDHECMPEEAAATPLGPDERATIEQYVAKIADGATRDAIRRVIEKDFLSRKKIKK
ncbi:MAG TPA: DUF721 domain-containing protein [Nitrospirota bacterium]|nr:DUF721 domain-containing protein [Nitrospirota bacterium]